MSRLSTHGRATLACLVLLAAAALLAAPAPAQAQTEIWSATLTPQTLADLDGALGCALGDTNTAAFCSDTAVLSDDDFRYDSTDYTVEGIHLAVGGIFQFKVDNNFTSAFDNVVLEPGQPHINHLSYQ